MISADVAVIGSGPAGIQAAIHSSRRKASTVLLGKTGCSAMDGTRIENYFGIPLADGGEMLRTGVSQAESFGCSIVPKHAISASAQNGVFKIALETGEDVEAKAVVLATGVSRNSPGVPGEKEFFGKGVSYCASCDCNFYRGVPVAVVGGGPEAALAAELMTRYASEVHWVSGGGDADPHLVGRAAKAGAIMVDGKLGSINGTAGVESITLADGREIRAEGVFIELGGRSAADLAMGLGVMPEIDDTVRVDAECRTSVEGVFACGDMAGKPWQVAKAVGQGAIAGAGAAEYSRRAKV